MKLSLKKLLIRLWSFLDKKNKLKFVFLLILMILASFAEVISIGAVIPFLGAMTSPETTIEIPAIKSLLSFLGIAETNNILTVFTIIFIAAALFSGLMRLYLLWFQTRLGHSVGASIGIEIYRRTLFQPYQSHVKVNSSEIISGITHKANVVVDIILLPLFSILGSTFILMSILCALILINPFIAIFSFSGFGLIYLFIIKITQKNLLKDGDRINLERVRIIKSLQEGLGGIRDVLLGGLQMMFVENFKKSEIPMRKAYARINILSMSPRYLIESLGMILIACMAFYLASQDQGLTSAIPLLGAFALGAQRLLPVLQQGYGGWQTMRGGKAQFQDAMDLLNQPLPNYLLEKDPSSIDISFNKKIELKNISFRYEEDSDDVITNVSLEIYKGQKIGFIGTTGSGKSTLVDIIMGLLSPSQGDLIVDDIIITNEKHRFWHKNIAHVPQSIFLTDATIKENIAFGVPPKLINMDLVRSAAEHAQISSVIDSLEMKYESKVGERGIKLSGGQIQRIGMARAIYKMANIIVLDEATSALDNKTEKLLINEIDKLPNNPTIIMVAHRISTLEQCDVIYTLEKGIIKSANTFDELQNS